MPLFDDRERAAERKFEQDNELRFKIRARRNKLLGIWAASHMGLMGEDAARYAMSIVEAELTHPDDDAIIRKICQDLVARGFPIIELDVRRRLEELGTEARTQVAHDTAPKI